jgi:methylthioribose-1-phosphate isomerase
VRTTPDGATAINPAFDVTPADLITAIVTDRRIVRPPDPPGAVSVGAAVPGIGALDEEEA